MISPGPQWDEKVNEINKQQYSLRYVYNEGTLRLTVEEYPRIKSRLYAEASLPKLLWGHNVTVPTLDQVVEAVKILEHDVTTVSPNVVVPPVSGWSLSRADFCYAWTVDDPDAYIIDISRTLKKKAQGQKIVGYANQGGGHGVMWGTKPHMMKLYSKHDEVSANIKFIDRARCTLTTDAVIALASRVLRFEDSLGRQQLERSVLKGKPTIGLLIDYLRKHGNGYIAECWKTFTEHWDPSEKLAVLARLKSSCSSNAQAISLWDWWSNVSSFGTEDYKSLTGMPRATFNRKLAQLKKAGVGLGCETSLIPLAITIPADAQL